MNEKEIRSRMEKISLQSRRCVKSLREIQQAMRQLDLDDALLADRNIRNHCRQMEEKIQEMTRLFGRVEKYASENAGPGGQREAFWEGTGEEESRKTFF